MRWLVILVLVAGCRKESRNAAPQPVENRVDAGASRPAPDADVCYPACMKSNQMRAVSIEQIEADCKAECARPSATTP